MYLINDAIALDTSLRLPTEIFLKGMQQEQGLERNKMFWCENCFGPPYTLQLIKSFISFSILGLENDMFSSIFYIINIYQCYC